jgi:GT2 family glycosyltransferase
MTNRCNDKVYIILLNWNGWVDTIECLESIFRNTYPHYQVVVCDNLSHDGSWERLQAWANGLLIPPAADNLVLRAYTEPPVPKPIPYVTYSRSAAENGGDAGSAAARLILVQTGGNLGYSAGNNVGLRYALARDDFAYIWLLNNDTVVKPDALTTLVARLQERKDAGICGSTLLYYDEPDVVQVRGGVAYNRWFGSMRPLGNGQVIDAAFDPHEVERAMGYPAGASMLVTRDFLRAVGLLSESYFLYYEELDWVTRARGRFAMAYSSESVVYHKGGRSVQAVNNDLFHHADYYAHRNRLRYTSKYFPIGLPTTVLRTFAAAVARFWRGQPRRAWRLVQLTFSPGTYASEVERKEALHKASRTAEREG